MTVKGENAYEWEGKTYPNLTTLAEKIVRYTHANQRNTAWKWSLTRSKTRKKRVRPISYPRRLMAESIIRHLRTVGLAAVPWNARA